MHRLSRSGALSYALLLTLSAGAASGQTVWVNPAGGNWSNVLNWSPQDVPNSLAESAILPNLTGPYVVGFDASASIAGVSIDSQTQLSVLGGRLLTLGTAGIVNNGTLILNSDGTSATGYVQTSVDSSITGSGSIVLNGTSGSSYARVSISASNATFHIGSGQTISGTGYLQQTGANSFLAIDGLVNADRNGAEIRLTGAINASGGGTFMGSNGGYVNVAGDLIGGTAAGDVQWMSTGSVNGTTAINTNRVVGGQTLNLKGSGLTNDGELVVNSNGAANNCTVRASETTMLGGNGVIQLNGVGSYSYAQITLPISDATLTIGPDLSIVGSGFIYESGTNSTIYLNGNVNADRSGSVIRLQGSINAAGDALIMGSNGGSVDMAADLVGGTLAGAVYSSAGSYDGAVATGVNGAKTSTVRLVNAGLSNQGEFDLYGGALVQLQSPTALNNNGLIVVNSTGATSTSYIEAITSSSILGAGTIELNAVGSSSYARLRAGGTGTVLTIGPDQTVTGAGYLQSAGAGAWVDLRGTVNANRNAAEIYLSGTIDATLGGVIQATNGGYVTLACNLVGGTIAGGVNANAVGTLNGTTAINNNSVPPGQTCYLVGNGLINNGVLTVNSGGTSSSSTLQANENTQLNGVGTIELNGVGSYSYASVRVSQPDTALTIGPDQEIAGSGQVIESGTNSFIRIHGPVNANRAGKVIRIQGDIDATSGGTFEGNNGGSVEIVADLVGGTLLHDVYCLNSSLNGVSSTGANGCKSGTTRLVGAGLHNLGSFSINAGGIMQIAQPSTLVNDGTILITNGEATASAYIQCLVPATITGVGTIELNAVGNTSYARILTNALDAALTLGADQAVTGTGTVQGTASNAPIAIAGTLAPGIALGDPTGSIQLEGQINFTPGTTTRIDVRGHVAADYDRLTGAGTVNLDGTLELFLLGGYLPTFGDRFTIIQVGTINGQFTDVITPELGLGLFRVVKTGANKIEAVWTCNADLNGDGMLDFFDVQNFLNAFSDEALYGDYNRDGRIDFFDVQAFLNDFSSGCL